MLFLELTAEEARTSSAGGIDRGPWINQVSQEVVDYNRRFSGAPRDFVEIIHDAPVLLRRLVTVAFSLRGLQALSRLRTLFLILVPIVYLLSPFDLLPEAVLGIVGLLDDVIVVVSMLLYATILYRSAYLQQG